MRRRRPRRRLLRDAEPDARALCDGAGAVQFGEEGVGYSHHPPSKTVILSECEGSLLSFAQS